MRRRLADALAPGVEPSYAKAATCQLLGEHLGAQRVVYIEVAGEGRQIEGEFAQGVPALRERRSRLSWNEAVAKAFAEDRVWAGEAGLFDPWDREVFLDGGSLAAPVNRDGELCGVLWVQAERGRAWTRDELNLVEEVADRLWAAIVQARAEASLRASEARMQLLTHISGAGTWDVDLTTGRTVWSESHFTLLGFEPTPGYEAEEWMWRESMYPDDMDAMFAEWRRAERERDTFRSEHRMVRRDGRVIWSRAAGKFFYNEDGHAVRFAGIFYDVTEQKQGEARLRRNHDTFFNLIENAPFGIYVVDSQFRLRQVSAAARRVFASVDPLLGRDFGEVLRIVWPEPFVSEALARFRHTLATGEPYAAPNTTERRGDIGAVESYDWKIDRVTLPDGEFGVVCYFYDITERKRAEDVVRRRTEQFETLLTQAPLGVYLVDADFKICEVNPRALPVFRTVDPVIGQDFGEVMRKLWPAPAAEELVRIFRRTLETGEGFEAPEETELRLDTNVREHYEWRVDRITLPDGRHGVVCYFRDISRQVFAREQIQESERRFRQLADFVPQIVWTAGPNGRVDYLNRRWYEFTGTTEALGDRWTELLHPEDVDRCLDLWRHVVRNGGAYEIEYRFREGRTGRYRWFLGRATAVRDSQGKIVKWFGTCTDVDDQKRASEHLEHIVTERTESLREKLDELEAFSYSISHDIRGPLRSMQGFANALLEEYADKLDATGEDYLRRIDRGAQRLDLLVRDVLAYSKLAKGEFQLQPVELAAFFDELVQSLDLKGGTLRLEGKLPVVRAHPALLSQIFANLVGNALKFANPDVPLVIRVRAERTRADVVRVWVEDNGIGIAPAHFGRIFEIFGRVHADRKYEGTGIGLAIVKKAAERLGGRTGVQSELGRGSRFWVELSLAG